MAQPLIEPTQINSSGLNADTLDGQDSTYYRNANNINAGTLAAARLSGTYSISINGNAATATNSSQLQTFVTGTGANNIPKLDAGSPPLLDLPNNRLSVIGERGASTSGTLRVINTGDGDTGIRIGISGAGNTTGVLGYQNSSTPSTGNSDDPSTGVHGLIGNISGTVDSYGVRGTNNALAGAGTKFDFYASGSATNYGPFTGAHDGLVDKGTFSYTAGDIVVDTATVINKSNMSNCIVVNELSTTSQQTTVVGVVTNQGPINQTNPPSALINREGTPDSDDNYPAVANIATLAGTYDRISINAIGEGQVNVIGEGGDISPGDYICTSSTAGKGMKQSDDVYHSYTVAKAREGATWGGDPNVVQTIACIYLCG